MRAMVGLHYTKGSWGTLSFTFSCISWLTDFSFAFTTTVFQLSLISSCFPLYDLASIMTYPPLTLTLLICLLKVHCWAGEKVLRAIHALRGSMLVTSTTSGCSYVSLTSAPEDPVPSSRFYEHLHFHAHSHTQKHTQD